MLHAVVGWLLAAVLLVAAGLKLAAPRAGVAALATFGVGGARGRWVVWGLVVAVEAGLGVGVALGVDACAWAAAGLMAAFAVAQAVALARGRGGAPCACFGARSRIGRGGVARNAALAVAFAVLPALPEGSASTEAWLTLGLAACALVIVGLVVVVLALVREIGVLRMALGPQQALEIPDEGPPLGERMPLLVARAAPGPDARLALAVFASDGCRLCQAVAPAVAMLAREPELAVVVLDEVRDADAWSVAAVPGSPYAVALDPVDATVLAKATFNSLAQLESIVATAARRAREGVGRAGEARGAADGARVVGGAAEAARGAADRVRVVGGAAEVARGAADRAPGVDRPAEAVRG